jgi:hypothetical protein
LTSRKKAVEEETKRSLGWKWKSTNQRFALYGIECTWSQPSAEPLEVDLRSTSWSYEYAQYFDNIISGGNYGKETPVPIPNTAVKLSSAGDTEAAALRENRSSPDIHQSSALNRRGASVYTGMDKALTMSWHCHDIVPRHVFIAYESARG